MDEPVDKNLGDDHTDRPTPQELALSAVLREHASTVEPDPGSLLRLRERVDSTPAAQRRWFGFAAPQLAIAAIVVAVAVVGATALTRTGGTDLETEPAVTTEPDPSAPSTTLGENENENENETDADAEELDDAETEVDAAEADDPADPDDPNEAAGDAVGVFQSAPPAEGFVAGPIRRTREEAASAFMALIRQPYGRIDVDGDRASVISLDEDGEISDRAVATLFFETVTGNSGTALYAVAEARSTEMTIDAPSPGTIVTDPVITVSGEGSGFEAGVAVSLISSFDGLMFDLVPGLAGWELAPYEVEVEASGTEHGWIVATSSIPLELVTPPFSAVPIAWELEPDPTTFTVSHIELDDPDGGLNVRNTPDLDESEVLETLPAGTSGIRRRGGLPAFVDGAVFWAVTTPSGGEGWVNRRFLVRDGAVSDDELLRIGSDFAAQLNASDTSGLSFLPWSESKPVLIGWAPGMSQVDGIQLSSLSFWQTPRPWAVPEETFGVGSIDERPDTFFAPAFDLTAAVRADGAASSSYPIVQDWIDPRFAGLRAVEVSAPDVAGGDVDRSFTLFVEPGPEGPQIVGVVVHLWIP